MFDEVESLDRRYHFRGRSEHVLDGKGRLNIPKRFREVLRRHGDDLVMITPWHKCLKAYPRFEWEKLEITLLDKGPNQPNFKKMLRYMIGGVETCSLDRQGRILLPPRLRVDGGLDKDVVVNGMVAYFEIWDQITWENENKPSAENFEEFEQNMSEMGLV